MAFVTELISAEDQQLIGHDQMRDPIGRPLRPYKWTIDREREMFLLQTYRGGEDAHHLIWFIFGVKGVTLSLQLSCKTYLQEGKAFYPWELAQPVDLPDNFQIPREKAIEAIKEALASFTNWGSPINQVTFNF